MPLRRNALSFLRGHVIHGTSGNRAVSRKTVTAKKAREAVERKTIAREDEAGTRRGKTPSGDPK